MNSYDGTGRGYTFFYLYISYFTERPSEYLINEKEQYINEKGDVVSEKDKIVNEHWKDFSDKWIPTSSNPTPSLPIIIKP